MDVCGADKAYRKAPGTMGTVRRADRMLAAQLHQRGVAVSAIENAFVLAGAGRGGGRKFAQESFARQWLAPHLGHNSNSCGVKQGPLEPRQALSLECDPRKLH